MSTSKNISKIEEAAAKHVALIRKIANEEIDNAMQEAVAASARKVGGADVMHDTGSFLVANTSGLPESILNAADWDKLVGGTDDNNTLGDDGVKELASDFPPGVEVHITLVVEKLDGCLRANDRGHDIVIIRDDSQQEWRTVLGSLCGCLLKPDDSVNVKLSTDRLICTNVDGTECTHNTSPSRSGLEAATSGSPTVTVSENPSAGVVAPSAPAHPRFVAVGEYVYDRAANRVAGGWPANVARAYAADLNSDALVATYLDWEDAK